MLFEALGDPHIDVIGDFGATVAPEQDRAPDSISPTSAGFDGVSGLPQTPARGYLFNRDQPPDDGPARSGSRLWPNRKIFLLFFRLTTSISRTYRKEPSLPHQNVDTCKQRCRGEGAGLHETHPGCYHPSAVSGNVCPGDDLA